MSSVQLVKIMARFVDAASDKPLNDPGLRVRFYDLDLLKDDFLGEAPLLTNGVAEIICSSGAFQSGLIGKFFARIRERRPDIYCEVVDKSGDPVFRTSVPWNIDPTKVNEVTQRSNPSIDLGTYKYRRSEGLPGSGLGSPVIQPE